MYISPFDFLYITDGKRDYSTKVMSLTGSIGLAIYLVTIILFSTSLTLLSLQYSVFACAVPCDIEFIMYCVSNCHCNDGNC